MYRLQNELDQAQFLPMADHGDMHHHAFRGWNEGADVLTHNSRECGPSWSSSQGRLAAIRVHFDGRGITKGDKRVKDRVGAGWLLQVADR